MIPKRLIRARPSGLAGKVLVTLLVASLVPFIAAQDKPGQICEGLHAALRGEPSPPYQQPPVVQLTFILLNDSEHPINAEAKSWRIVIDGKELKDSDFILCCGPRPAGGFGTLKPGEWYEFGVALDLGKYFPEKREYQVSWKGNGFQSSAVVVDLMQ